LIIVDTSVWVDHLRHPDAALAALLDRGQVLMHPYVVGEIACGSLSDREFVLELLRQLPMAPVAEPDEALGFIAMRRLHGKGIGYVDVHLLASTALSAGSTLWTRDKRLHDAARALGCAYAARAAG
jgi:predicted nucleic acid-binding protein